MKNKYWHRLTDWRCFQSPAEPLETFNKNFNIWACAFNDLSEIESWEKQLSLSVGYCEQFYQTIRSDKWLIENSTYHALIILKTKSDDSGLMKKFNELKNDIFLDIDSSELDSFYKILNQKQAAQEQ